MASKVFVDTDVIIDFLTDRNPFSDFSSLIFELHEKEIIEIHVSAVSINNIYYISRKIIGEKQARALISELIDNIEIVGTTKKEIEKALLTKFKDFEDSIQFTTALTIENIEAIITRNTKDYKHSTIAVFTPEIYLKSKTPEL